MTLAIVSFHSLLLMLGRWFRSVRGCLLTASCILKIYKSDTYVLHGYSPILSNGTVPMTLVKVPFLILDAINILANATPPNLCCETIIPDSRERFLGSLGWPSRLLRGMYWTLCSIEIVVILASQFHGNIVSKRILAALILNHPSPRRVRVTPLFVLGNILSICGTALRLQSFRTLGPFFTFELCIWKDHRLVVDGPYAHIRHPSYTGLILTIVGYFCTHASGSWLSECGLLKTVAGKVVLCVWSTIAAAVVASLLLRVSREDDILRMKFGEEWEVWAQRVPYGLVPGVY